MTTTLPAVPASPSVDANDLRVTRVRPLRGPNYWRLAPVIACDVRLGSLEQRTTAELTGFSDNLLNALPTLREHPCSRGSAGGFVERLQEGTHLPHVLEHVSLELQTLAGSDVSFGRVVPSGDEGVWWVIVAYEEEEVGVESMHEAARLVRACLEGIALDTGRDAVRSPAALRDRAARPVHRGDRRGGPPQGDPRPAAEQSLAGAARTRPQPAADPGHGHRPYQLDRGGDRPGQGRDEARARQHRPAGAAGRRARSVDDAIAVAEEIGFPVIVKPLDASHGRGISRRIDDVDGLRHAFEEAQQYSRRVVIEQFAQGATTACSW